MIEILKVENQDNVDELLSDVGLSGADYTVLAMCDTFATAEKARLGQIVLKVDEDKLILYRIVVRGYSFQVVPNLEEKFTLDSLVRAAASFGETFGVKQIQTKFPDFFDFMKGLGFEVNAEGLSTPIETIVKYSKLT